MPKSPPSNGANKAFLVIRPLIVEVRQANVKTRQSMPHPGHPFATAIAEDLKHEVFLNQSN